MTVTLLPDVERLLSSFLRDQAEVVALCDDRVYTALPKPATFPAVRLTRVGGRPVTNRPLWLDAPIVQVDVWGGAKTTARRLAETIRAVCADRLVGVHDDGVVTDVTFGQLRWQPDTTFEKPQPRYLVDLTVFLRPLTVIEGGS